MPVKNHGLSEEARRVVRRLVELRRRIVFAESCTGGLVAAAMVEAPGASDCLCGTVAVYREATKTEWLGVSPQVLKEHGAVSSEVAATMAEGILERTPEADLSASVTGYLEPDAPTGKEGLAFIAVALRNSGAKPRLFVEEHRVRDQSARPEPFDDGTVRRRQQQVAACLVLEQVQRVLDREASGKEDRGPPGEGQT